MCTRFRDDVWTSNVAELEQWNRRNYVSGPQPRLPDAEDDKVNLMNEFLKQRHEKNFPYSDNLFTLIFICASLLMTMLPSGGAFFMHAL